MVQSIISLSEEEDRILNIVKAKYGLKNKSQAVAMITKIYEEELLEPELKPEYIDKAKEIMGKKALVIGSIKDFKKRYDNNVFSGN